MFRGPAAWDRFMSIDSISSGMSKISIGPRPYMAAMPVVLVGSDVEGRPNFMTAAWAGVACMDPPMVSVAINKARYTEKGIMENRTFSLNIPATGDVERTDLCGLISGKKDDKSQLFEVFYARTDGAPMIRSFPINIECELFHTADLGSHDLHVGKVIDVHADEDCLSKGIPDVGKVDPIVYSSGMYYRIGEPIGKAYSVGKGPKKA